VLRLTGKRAGSKISCRGNRAPHRVGPWEGSTLLAPADRVDRRLSPRDVSVNVRPGDLLAGKYRVERIIAVGGMGVIVAAHHLELDERVALKFLLPKLLERPAAIARFLREARAAVKIKNEHVARVSDVGKLENGSPYIVMEYLEGLDLAAWLEKRGPIPAEQAVDFVLQACEALAEAHSLGIVHRDLKPANLFCIQRSDGQLSIKVLDFGISKLTAASAEQDAMSLTSAPMGSPYYMSPEQMKAASEVDARTDIWSLGVILFELITSRGPFEAEGVTGLVVKVTTEPPAPLSRYLPTVAPDLERLVERCLEKDRDRRFQTIGELALALRQFAPQHSGLSVDRVVGTLHRAGTVTDPGGSSELPPPIASSPRLAPGRPHAQTITAWGEANPRKRYLGSAFASAAAVVVVVSVAFGVMQATAHSPPLRAGADTASAFSAVPPTSAPSPPPSAGSVPTVIPLLPPVASAAGPTPVSAPRPVRVAPAPPPARPKITCDPPYYADANGTRHFKKECL